MCRILSHTVQIRLYFNMTHIWYRMKDNENTAMSEKLEKGCYVLSLSGRDSGRIHVVLCCGEDEYAYIADGRCRTVSKPKKKKRRHLRRIGLPPYRGAFTDSAIAAAVKAAADVPDL